MDHLDDIWINRFISMYAFVFVFEKGKSCTKMKNDMTESIRIILDERAINSNTKTWKMNRNVPQISLRKAEKKTKK